MVESWRQNVFQIATGGHGSVIFRVQTTDFDPSSDRCWNPLMPPQWTLTGRCRRRHRHRHHRHRCHRLHFRCAADCRRWHDLGCSERAQKCCLHHRWPHRRPGLQPQLPGQGESLPAGAGAPPARALAHAGLCCCCGCCLQDCSQALGLPPPRPGRQRQRCQSAKGGRHVREHHPHRPHGTATLAAGAARFHQLCHHWDSHFQANAAAAAADSVAAAAALPPRSLPELAPAPVLCPSSTAPASPPPNGHRSHHH